MLDFEDFLNAMMKFDVQAASEPTSNHTVNASLDCERFLAWKQN